MLDCKEKKNEVYHIAKSNPMTNNIYPHMRHSRFLVNRKELSIVT